jgi:hypothetical protein
MKNIEPKEKYIIIHPKEEDGSELQHSFILVLGQKLSEKVGTETIGDRMVSLLTRLNGIDAYQLNLGMYSLHVTIARTFDSEEVLNEFKRLLEDEVLSSIVKPTLITS